MSSKLELYVVAAQVIPLLLGFLAFELRSFAIDESIRAAGLRASLPPLFSNLILLALLFLGELAAIHALSQGRPSRSAQTAVETALFGGGVMLVFGIVVTTLKPVFKNGSRILSLLPNAILVVAVSLWLLLS